MQGGREGGSGYDIRLFEKPRPFCGQETAFTEFRFRLHSYLDVVGEKFSEEAEAAEPRTGPTALPTRGYGEAWQGIVRVIGGAAVWQRTQGVAGRDQAQTDSKL